jgi:stage V sporulation protein R
MMQDLERIVTAPEAEDREWFPDIAGKVDAKGDAMPVLRDIWANYRDESFISQFLSPRLMRQMRMFHLCDDPEQTEGVVISAIHDERGYRRIRRQLAREYDISWTDPNIEVVDVDLAGDRRLLLRHSIVNGCMLEEKTAAQVLQHVADLWSYDVQLQEVDASGAVLKEHTASPRAISRAA